MNSTGSLSIEESFTGASTIGPKVGFLGDYMKLESTTVKSGDYKL